MKDCTKVLESLISLFKNIFHCTSRYKYENRNALSIQLVLTIYTTNMPKQHFEGGEKKSFKHSIIPNQIINSKTEEKETNS